MFHAVHVLIMSGSQLSSPPLCDVDWLDDPWYLVDEGDGSGDVVEDATVSDLLPRHRHVLQQLQDRVRHVLERAAKRARMSIQIKIQHFACYEVN